MMNIKDKIVGTGMERMPDFAFRIMDWSFKIRDLFPVDRKIEAFGIRRGDTVIDYGCGPGGYLEKAASLAGPSGMVYGIDIHELAIESVRKRIAKKGLGTIVPILANGYATGLPDQVADLIYALDMFHMVRDSTAFLSELHRLLKKSGRLLLEDGHQPRAITLQKIEASGKWRIIDGSGKQVICNPL